MTALPSVLLPYQAAWVADDDPFKVAEKGRRTGLTWAEASDDVLIASADKSAGGQNVYYIGTDKEMTEEFIDAAAMWAKAFNRAAGEIQEGIWGEGEREEDRHIQTFTIRFPKSGNKIVALASRPRKLRGRQGVLVGDEGAYQDDLPGFLKAGMAFIMWGGKVRVISTHDGEMNDFNQLVEDIRSGRQKGSLHRITLRDAVRQGLYKRVCLRMGKEWSAAGEAAWVESIYDYYRDNAAEELDCIPGQGSGIWLHRNLIESCMDSTVPVFRWEPPAKDFVDWPLERAEAEVADWLEVNIRPALEAMDPKAPCYLGEDFGRSGDITVLWPTQVLGDLFHKTPFVLELRNAPFRTQAQILKFVCNGFPRFCGGAFDARGNGQFLAEFARQTYGAGRVAEVMLTEPWYRENMPRVKAGLEDRSTSLPKDREILEDFRAFRMVRGVPRLPDGNTGAKNARRHGDSGVAKAMSDFAAAEFSASYGPPEYRSASPRRFGDQEGTF